MLQPACQKQILCVISPLKHAGYMILVIRDNNFKNGFIGYAKFMRIICYILISFPNDN